MTPLLEADAVDKSYLTGRPGWFRKPRRFRAVDGVSLHVMPGETVGIVGESGCGKSTLARLLLGLSLPDSGRVLFDGQDMAGLDVPRWRALRTRLQLVFQDTGGALDPRLTVRTQVREGLDIHGIADAEVRTTEVLDAVRLGRHLWDRYPHELSGGQLQRVIIARALMLQPDLMVLDEPVSALDVSIQAQIVNLLADLQRRFGMAYVFVSHDLGVVRHVADRVYVMYLGQVVEHATKAALFGSPMHPYTAALLDAVPAPDPGARRRRAALSGDPPSPHNPPAGCRFHPRCAHATDICGTETPALRPVRGHTVACHHAETIADIRAAARQAVA